jgi:hypothetical protein
LTGHKKSGIVALQYAVKSKVHSSNPLRSAAPSESLDTMLQFRLLDEGWMLFENLDGCQSGEAQLGRCRPAK